MDKQKEVNRKNKQSIRSSNRSSQQFIYNPDYERHIGKRTGNYYGRVNPKQNFDGFPRFSQYQSHRNTTMSSLARQSSGVHSISARQEKKQTHTIQVPKLAQPFSAKQSPILGPMDSNTSSRFPQIGIPNFGQNVISSIKRRTSVTRPSEMKSYRDLLQQLQADQFKEFIFNEQEIESIVSSAKKQIQKSIQYREQVKGQPNKKVKKQKQNKRVSFNEKMNRQPQSNYIVEQKKMQKIQISKIVEVNKNSPNQLQVNDKKYQKQEQQSTSFHFNYQPERLTNKQQSNRVTIQTKQQLDIKKSQQYYDSQSNRVCYVISDDVKSEISQNMFSQVNVQQSTKNKNAAKKNRRKKQIRVTDNPSNIEITQSIEKEDQKTKNQNQLIQKRQQNSRKNQKKTKNPKQKNKSKRSKKQRTKSELSERQKKQKMVQDINDQYSKNEYIEQLTSDNNEMDGRYPRRTRIKPVQYWENERVHYRSGRAMGIERANLSLKELLQANQNFQSVINVNFHSHDIQIDVSIPAKKQLNCRGIGKPYQELLIQLKTQGNNQQQFRVYFDDGKRSQFFKPKSTIIIQSYTYFQIVNKSNFPIKLYMILKVKVS